MKRHRELQDLSREHHAALQLALLAKRAAMSGEPARIVALATTCRAAFCCELEPHFVVEETTLLPLLVDSGKEQLAAQLKRDHQELRRLSVQLQQPDGATLLGFSQLLTAHVRFEERQMFAAIEAYLNRDDTAAN